MIKYEPLRKHIKLVDTRNADGLLGEDELYGISITKDFITSHANLVGVSFENYKVVESKQFAYIPDTSRRGDRIAISLNSFEKKIIVSSICTVFEIVDKDELLPEFLMLWFRRPEFDRYARFMSNGSAREVFDWDCMCGVEIPVPPIDKQREIVHAYQVIIDRISLLRTINYNLETQAIAICNNAFPISEDKEENGIIADICVNIYSGGTPDTSEDEYWNGVLPWLSSGETSNSYITKTEKHISIAGVQNSSTKLAKAGCTVIASAGQGKTRGQASFLLIDTYVNQSVVVLQPKIGFEYVLFSNMKNRYEEMRQLSDLDSIRGSLTTKSIGSLPFSMNRDETINAKLALLFEMIKHNSFELDKLESLKALMSRSML